MELKGKVLHALRWTASLRLLSQFLTWAMTLYVVRLISVDDYGLYSLAMIFGSLLMWVNELGIGAALVQKKNISLQDYRLGFGVVILTNLLFSLILVLLSPVIADYFNEPKLTPILQTIAIGFMSNAFIVIPESYLTRKLDFKRKSIVELVSNFSGGLITLVFAYLGHGIWAMVYGFVSIWGIRAIGLNFISPIHVWPKFSIREGKHILRFGGLVTLDHLSWYVYARADAFIIGKLLGTNVLGIYSVALHIASMPMQKINGLLNEIAFPAFSSIQSDLDSIQWYLLKAIRLISFFAFPVFFGIASIAPVFVEIVLGDKWAEAAYPLTILCLVMPLRMIANIYSSTLRGIGKAGLSVILTTVTGAILVIGFLIGAKWGMEGICISWLITVPVCNLVIALTSKSYFGFGIIKLISELITPLMTSACMFAVVTLSYHQLITKLPPILVLLTQISLGAMIYILLTLLLNRQSYNEVIALRSH